MSYYIDLILQCSLVVVMGFLFQKTFTILRKETKNKQINLSPIEEQHIKDRLGVTVGGFIGSALGFAFSFLKLIETHVLQILPHIWITSGLFLSEVILVAAGYLMFLHMENEETPGHPYFFVDTHGKKGKNK